MTIIRKSKQNPIWIVFFVLIIFAFAYLFFDFLKGSQTKTDHTAGIVKTPKTLQGKLSAGVAHAEYTLYNLPVELDKARIHDILFYSGAMWLGTDKGLAKIVDNQVTVYKQFSDWPFEWVRDLVATPYGIALQIHVAEGNTGGTRAGSHIFNPELETWEKIGNNILAQTWFDGYLYQAGSNLIRRKPGNFSEREVLLTSMCGGRPSSLTIKTINNEIWLTGEGTTLNEHTNSRSGCGVIRYNPKSGRNTVYKTQDGLNHNIGWDLDGDNKTVYVSHSVKHNQLSFYDFEKAQWFSMRTGGSGNVIFVTPDAIWMARGTPRRPLRRIGRKFGQGKSFSPFSDNEYVSAIGININEVWLGIYEKHWSKGTYTITSKLGLYREK